jgi:hypothetical protein
MKPAKPEHLGKQLGNIHVSIAIEVIIIKILLDAASVVLAAAVGVTQHCTTPQHHDRGELSLRGQTGRHCNTPWYALLIFWNICFDSSLLSFLSGCHFCNETHPRNVCNTIETADGMSGNTAFRRT